MTWEGMAMSEGFAVGSTSQLYLLIRAFHILVQGSQ